MRKISPIILVAVFVVLIAISGIIYIRYAYFPKYKWTAQFRTNKKQPYDIHLFYSLLEKNNTQHKFNKTRYNPYTYKDSLKTNQVFICFNNNTVTDSVSLAHILRMVNRGNHLVVFRQYPDYLLYTLFQNRGKYKSRNSKTFTTDTVQASTNNVVVPFHFKNGKKTRQYSYNYIHTENFNDSLLYKSSNPIGFLNDSLLNCLQVPYGNGSVLIHTNPLFFTNYHLKRDSAFSYCNQVLSQIPAGDIVWFQRSFQFNNHTRATQLKKGPIHYLLSQKAFRYAWYMMVLLVIIAVIFGSKRKQKVIPYITPLKNGSVDFASTIATFYYQSHNHSYIADEMMKLFWMDLRERYKLSKKNDRSKLVEPLSEFSGLKKEHFTNLFRAEANVKYSNNQDSEYLITLYQLLETYYKKRK